MSRDWINIRIVITILTSCYQTSEMWPSWQSGKNWTILPLISSFIQLRNNKLQSWLRIRKIKVYNQTNLHDWRLGNITIKYFASLILLHTMLSFSPDTYHNQEDIPILCQHVQRGGGSRARANNDKLQFVSWTITFTVAN